MKKFRLNNNMNAIRLSVLLLSVIVFFSCGSRETIIKNHSTNAAKAKNNQIFIIPSSLFLENRVANCDSAIAYMKNVLVPGDGKNSYRVIGESDEFLSGKLETESYVLENNKRFYVSTDCLLGQKIQIALDIFVLPEFQDSILK